MTLVPIYNKLIVEIIPDETESKSSSGLILMNVQSPFYRGTVTAVGKGHYQNAQRIAMDVVPGQVIRFLKNSGMGVSFDSTGNPTHVVLADVDVYAIETE